jgi:hypothetical protein
VPRFPTIGFELVLLLCVRSCSGRSAPASISRLDFVSLESRQKFGVLLLIQAHRDRALCVWTWARTSNRDFCSPQSRPFLGGDHRLPHRREEDPHLLMDIHAMPGDGVCRRDASRDKSGRQTRARKGLGPPLTTCTTCGTHQRRSLRPSFPAAHESVDQAFLVRSPPSRWAVAPRVQCRENAEMDQFNRRAMMRGILCGAAVVGVGLALPPVVAEAMPIDAGLANTPDGLIEDVQWHGNNWNGNNWTGVAGADGSAGGIVDAVSAAGVNRKADTRGRVRRRTQRPVASHPLATRDDHVAVVLARAARCRTTLTRYCSGLPTRSNALWKVVAATAASTISSSLSRTRRSALARTAASIFVSRGFISPASDHITVALAVAAQRREPVDRSPVQPMITSPWSPGLVRQVLRVGRQSRFDRRVGARGYRCRPWAITRAGAHLGLSASSACCRVNRWSGRCHPSRLFRCSRPRDRHGSEGFRIRACISVSQIRAGCER